jgi:L-idonate 5-dehydrogenase
MKGTFRFHEEFALAVALINRRAIDPRPLLTGAFPLQDATKAFELAGDRARDEGSAHFLNLGNCSAPVQLAH